VSTDRRDGRHALYYPFHLCHERTLERLLTEYASVHFRDYMALQLTALSGTTASSDRMGDRFGSLVRSGRIVQGHSVSGPLDPDMVAAIDRDLGDETWRALFHNALLEDRRFQRGLFDLSHGMIIGSATIPGPAAFLELTEDARQRQPFTVQRVRRLSGSRGTLPEGYDYEYGLALIETSAALAYTIRLCLRHELEAVTDSAPHYALLAHTCTRDGINLDNHNLPREGY
jgi:hypothetical protein